MPTQHRSGDSNGLAAEDRSDKKHKKPYYPPYYSGPKTYTVPKVTVQLNVSPEKTFKFAADDVSLAPINAGHSTVLTASLVKPGHREVKKVAPVPLDVSKVVPELLKLFGVFAGKKPYSHYWSAVDIFLYNWASLIHSFFAIIKLIHLRGKWGKCTWWLTCVPDNRGIVWQKLNACKVQLDRFPLSADAIDYVCCASISRFNFNDRPPCKSFSNTNKRLRKRQKRLDKTKQRIFFLFCRSRRERGDSGKSPTWSSLRATLNRCLRSLDGYRRLGRFVFSAN